MLIPALFLVGFFFAQLGVLVGVRAEQFDDVSFAQTFVLQPLIFLGGVFYSASLLDEPFQTLTHFNPIYYMINLVRYGFLGYTEANIALSLGVLTAGHGGSVRSSTCRLFTPATSCAPERPPRPAAPPRARRACRRATRSAPAASARRRSAHARHSSSRLSSIQAAGRPAAYSSIASSFQWAEPNTARPSKVRTGSSLNGSFRMNGRYSLAFSSQPVAQTSSNRLRQPLQARAAVLGDAMGRCRRPSGRGPEASPRRAGSRTG